MGGPSGASKKSSILKTFFPCCCYSSILHSSKYLIKMLCSVYAFALRPHNSICRVEFFSVEDRSSSAVVAALLVRVLQGKGEFYSARRASSRTFPPFLNALPVTTKKLKKGAHSTLPFSTLYTLLLNFGGGL